MLLSLIDAEMHLDGFFRKTYIANNGFTSAVIGKVKFRSVLSTEKWQSKCLSTFQDEPTVDMGQVFDRWFTAFRDHGCGRGITR